MVSLYTDQEIGRPFVVFTVKFAYYLLFFKCTGGYHFDAESRKVIATIRAVDNHLKLARFILDLWVKVSKLRDTKLNGSLCVCDWEIRRTT